MGLHPAESLIKSLWKRFIVCEKQDKLSFKLYDLMYKMHTISFCVNRTEQNIYLIDVNCTVSCQIHEYYNKFTNGHNRCIHDLKLHSL